MALVPYAARSAGRYALSPAIRNALRERGMRFSSSFLKKLTRAGAAYFGQQAKKYMRGKTNTMLGGMKKFLTRKRGRGSTGARRNIRQRTGPRGHRYLTLGRSAGHFKKAMRRPDFNKFKRFGCVYQAEHGGTVTDSQFIMLGHTCWPNNVVWKSVVRSIVRELLRQSGLDFPDWEEPLGIGTTNYQLSYQYAVTEDAAAYTTRTLTVTAAQTPEGLTGQLLDDILDNATGATDEGLRFRKFSMSFDSTAFGTGPPAANSTFATLNAETFYVTVKMVSTLLLQNRTRAEATDTSTEHHDHISNNPLLGKLIEGTTNGFRLRQQETSVTSRGSLIGNAFTGVIYSAALEDTFDKVPAATSFVNAKRTTRVHLDPGEIKKHTLSMTKRHNLNTWAKIMQKFVSHSTSSTNEPIPCQGKSAIFCLEKLLDSRDDEPDISIGYELNHTVSAYGQAYKGMVAKNLNYVQT